MGAQRPQWLERRLVAGSGIDGVAGAGEPLGGGTTDARRAARDQHRFRGSPIAIVDCKGARAIGALACRARGERLRRIPNLPFEEFALREQIETRRRTPTLPVRLLASWLTNALVLGIVAALLSGVRVSGAGALLGAAALFGVLNPLVKPFRGSLTSDCDPDARRGLVFRVPGDVADHARARERISDPRLLGR